MMNFIPQVTKSHFLILSLAALGLAGLFTNNMSAERHAEASSFLVQGNQASGSVSRIGGQITHDLNIINAVAANLTPIQVDSLKLQGLKLTPNYSVKNSGVAWGQRIGFTPASAVQMSNTHPLHEQHIFGDGVTIVVLDSGVKTMSGIRHDVYDRHRVYGTYDAIKNKTSVNDQDDSGHGTHVASVAINSEFDSKGRYYGIAPNARLISVKAFDKHGKGTYADVIRGIQWSVYYKDSYNIRVLNLSFSAEVKSLYWQDPINQAVMEAWKSGITVVTSSGNTGSSAGHIGVPGNNPYIITVGAVTDNYTPDDFSDDRLAKFSSAGPTYERFIKPEVVAPGGHLMGLMEDKSQIAQEHPEFHDGGKYFTMSGTSQAAAVVSGIVALMVSQDSQLDPDTIKCRLMITAKEALTKTGEDAYSPFQQGAGQVDAFAAVNSDRYGCANAGLDISKDLSGEAHFVGNVRASTEGKLYIKGNEKQWSPSEYSTESGFNWSSTGSDVSIWPDYETWNDVSIWPDHETWNDVSIWPDHETWHDVSIWPDSSAMQDVSVWPDSNAMQDVSVWPDFVVTKNVWVEQE